MPVYHAHTFLLPANHIVMTVQMARIQGIYVTNYLPDMDMAYRTALDRFAPTAEAQIPALYAERS